MTVSPDEIMARTIWGEARGEGRLGMTAVGWVIKNRAMHPGWWGHDIVSVCLCADQFSCWNEGDPNLPKLKAVTEADPQFALAMDIAAAVIFGRVGDPTNGATNYHALGADPTWADRMTPCCTIGHHIFYRDQETFE